MVTVNKEQTADKIYNNWKQIVRSARTRKLNP